MTGLLSQEDLRAIETYASKQDDAMQYTTYLRALLAHIRAQDPYVAVVERLAKWWDGSDEPSEAAYELDEIAADAYERVRAVQSSENPHAPADIPKEAQ